MEDPENTKPDNYPKNQFSLFAALCGVVVILIWFILQGQPQPVDYASQIKGTFPHFEYCYNGQPQGEYASVWCALTSSEVNETKTVLMRNLCFSTDNQDGTKTIWCKPDDDAVFQKIKIA